MESMITQEVEPKVMNNFLISCRDYFGKGSVIREIGNFIAHPKRDKGISNDQVKFINGIQKILQDIEGKKPKNFIDYFRSGLIPRYYYYVLKFYYKDVEPDIRFVDDIKNNFDNSSEEGKLKYHGSFTKNVFNRIIRPMLNIEEIAKNAPIHEEHIIQDIKNFLKSMSIDMNTDLINQNREDIIACTMCILHGCNFENSEGNLYPMSIGFDHLYSSRPYRLFLYCHLEEVEVEGIGKYGITPIISTDIPFRDYVEGREYMEKSDGNVTYTDPMSRVYMYRNEKGTFIKTVESNLAKRIKERGKNKYIKVISSQDL